MSNETNGHWYRSDGTPCHWVPKKDGSGNRPTTLADARKLQLFPSVTTILKTLHRQALVEWLIDQAVNAVLTAPRLDGETLDAFKERVLKGERQQDQESQIARDRGTEMHAALAELLQGRDVSPEILPWVKPAFDAVSHYGKTISCEKCVVGEGYAGTLDLLQSTPVDTLWIWDFKTSKKLPTKGAWWEHQCQCGAYASAVQPRYNTKIFTGNVYISTVNCGEFVICEHEGWVSPAKAFRKLVDYWQIANNYVPMPEVAL